MIPIIKKILSGKIKLFLKDAYICGKTINKNRVMVQVPKNTGLKS